MNEGKYLNLWNKYIPAIRILLKRSITSEQKISLNNSEFESAGDREASGYTFNLEIEKGKVVNDITGTAVARDLYAIIKKDAAIKEFLKERKIKISLGKSFVLKIKTL